MERYCHRCGKALPESGICDCTTQLKMETGGYTPPKYSAPNPVSVGLANLPMLLLGYFRDPVGTSRLAMEKKDTISSAILMGIVVMVNFFSCLFLTLRYSSARFGRISIEWAVTGLFAPVVAIAITMAMLYLIASISGVHTDSRRLFALVGVNTIFPLVFMLLSMVLSMVHLAIFQIFAVMIFGAWIVTFFLMIVHVLGVRINVGNGFVLIIGMTVAYFVISLLKSWLTTGMA